MTFEEGKERNTALGILGGIAGSGAAIGVLLGGVLTEFAGWQWIFFVNVPIGVAGALPRAPLRPGEPRGGDCALVRRRRRLRRHRGLMVLVYALTQASTKGWGSAQTIVPLLGVGRTDGRLHPDRVARLAAAAPARDLPPANADRGKHRRLRARDEVFGMFFLLSLYMQQVLGFSALQTGVAYLAVAWRAVVASGVSQAARHEARREAGPVTGMITLTSGLLLFAQISVNGSYFSDLFPGFILVGVGLGFSFVPISIAALAGIEPQEAGLASGLINTRQQIGGALGVAILTTVAISRATTSSPPAPRGPWRTRRATSLRSTWRPRSPSRASSQPS